MNVERIDELLTEAGERLAKESSLANTLSQLEPAVAQDVIEEIDQELHSAEAALTAAFTTLYQDVVTALTPKPGVKTDRALLCWAVYEVLDCATEVFYTNA